MNSIPAEKTRYIFIANTRPVAREILKYVNETVRSAIGDNFILVVSRNENFYNTKNLNLQALNDEMHIKYGVVLNKKGLSDDFDVIEVGHSFSEDLDDSLIRRGMKVGQMPSTGLIAYEWLKTIMNTGDELRIAGFTHSGWWGHPWELEKDIIKDYVKP